jgi:stringent starvation protein B
MQKDLKAFIKLRCDIINKTIESISLSGYEPNIICLTESIKDLPEHLYSEKFITLNVSVEAVGAFSITDEYLNIEVKFSGKTKSLFIPLLAIIIIYGKEDGIPIIRIDLNNSIIASEDLTRRFIDYCKNGSKKDVEEKMKEKIIGTNLCPEIVLPISQQAPKTVPHLKRVK